MNNVSERYNTKVEIPISVILETIFSDDNHDVETLSRWAKHYGFARFLTRTEIEKAQTLPKDYLKNCSYNQVCDLAGDGWTVDVIAHIFSFIEKGDDK